MTQQSQSPQTARVAARASSGDSAGVAMTVTNPALNSQPLIYVGVSATLAVVLTNHTGDDLTLQPSGTGTGPSCMKIFLPAFFDAGTLANMNISLAGWTFSRDTGAPALVLTYSGAATSAWEDGDTISFNIEGALTNAAPATHSVQVNFTGVAGKLRHSPTASLVLSAKPDPTKNASLTDVLQVGLDNLGVVYVTADDGNPLSNTLFLNLKNTGDSPLFVGTAAAGNPRITVTFVYGRTAGALAPDDDKTDTGSIWNVQATPVNDPNGTWSVASPSINSGDTDPHWVLTPNATGILGPSNSDTANISFRFPGIISRTPPGHTQMLVQFTGFRRDDNTLYDDYLFVVDISKQDAPAAEGVQRFFGPSNKLTAADATTKLEIPFRWMLYYASQVDIIAQDKTVLTRKYPGAGAAPLIYDSGTVELSGISESTSIKFDLKAYDANHDELNALQFAVDVAVPPKINSFTGELENNPFAINLSWDVQGIDQCTLAGQSQTYAASGGATITPDIHAPVRATYTLCAGEAPAGVTRSVGLKWGRTANFKVGGLGGRPVALAVAPNNARIYLVSSAQAQGVVSVLDVGSGNVISTMSMPADAISAAVSGDGRVYIGNWSTSGFVSLVDCTVSPPVAHGKVDVTGIPVAIAASPDGRSVYVVSKTADQRGQLAAITADPGSSSPTVVQTAGVGTGPAALAVTPDGSRVFVGKREDKSVLEATVTPSGLHIFSGISLGTAIEALAMAPDGKSLYVLGDDHLVTLIDTTTRPAKIKDKTNRPFNASRIVVSADSSRLYGVGTNGNVTTLWFVEFKFHRLGEVQDAIQLSGLDATMAVSPDGVNIYVAYRDISNGNFMMCVASPVSIG